MEKKVFSVLIHGQNVFEKHKVFCTLEELKVFCGARIAYIHQIENGACVCVAKEGHTVSYKDYDHKFCDYK